MKDTLTRWWFTMPFYDDTQCGLRFRWGESLPASSDNGPLTVWDVICTKTGKLLGRSSRFGDALGALWLEKKLCSFNTAASLARQAKMPQASRRTTSVLTQPFPVVYITYWKAVRDALLRRCAVRTSRRMPSKIASKAVECRSARIGRRVPPGRAGQERAGRSEGDLRPHFGFGGRNGHGNFNGLLRGVRRLVDPRAGRG